MRFVVRSVLAAVLATWGAAPWALTNAPAQENKNIALEPIFEPDAKLKVEVGDGAGGEGPAWHPKLGLLTSGASGHVFRLDRAGKSSVFRKNAGTNGLLFDAQGRLLACEPRLRRVTRMDPDGALTVLTDKYDGKPSIFLPAVSSISMWERSP